MTIILVAFGSSLMAISMFLLDRATETSIISWGYMGGTIASITLSFFAWGWALFREWEREKAQKQSEDEREKREKARFEEDKQRWEREKDEKDNPGK